MRRVAVALVHFPVLDRSGQIVTTAITNLDLHDIARSAHTFGVERFYAVHPIAAQRELAQRVRDHWVFGSGKRRIPDREGPMTALQIVSTLQEAEAHLGGGAPVERWVTSAQRGAAVVSHGEARLRLASEGPPVLLVFGTGWGLAPSVVAEAALHLAPILSPRPDGFNHLSVRAAAAIFFDRLLGVAEGRGGGVTP